MLTQFLLLMVMNVSVLKSRSWMKREAVENTMLTKRTSSGTPYGQTCTKAKNIAFLKVHKAGSTSINSIMTRYGTEHNLNFVLPNTLSGPFNYLGYGVTLKKERVIPLPGNGTYNILCHHVVYNRTAFQKVMPTNTIYIGIVREPRSHFVSAALYYLFVRHLQAKNVSSMNHSNFSDLIGGYFDNQSMFDVNSYFVHNKMSFDLGLPLKDFQNEINIHNFVKKISAEVDLMLILEYMDESIVLMRRYLCWELKDVLYIEKNVRSHKPNIQLTDSTLAKLATWNKADYILYDYFKNKFLHTIEREGNGFAEEVAQFKLVRNRVVLFCKGETSDKDVLSFKASKWNPVFSMNKTDCKTMMSTERQIITELIRKAFKKLNMTIDASAIYNADTGAKLLDNIHA